MTEFVLINWDVSRTGQSNQWAIHIESDGTEVQAWAQRPSKRQIMEAKALNELPSSSNLPDPTKQAQAIGVAADSSNYYKIRESTESNFPPW